MTRTYTNELISIVQGKAGDTLKQICNEKNRDKVDREFSLLDIIYAKKKHGLLLYSLHTGRATVWLNPITEGKS